MSGIFGYINKKDDYNNKKIEYLDAWNREYGKNCKCIKRFSHVALGARMSHIRVDVNKETEVLQENDFFYGVFDALIYNREEIIYKLSMYGYKKNDLETSSDEKLLFLVYLCEGEEGLRSVNGDFTGAVYNEKDESISLFRDHLGIRPLFIYEDENVFAFSTDYRGLLAMPDADARICEEYFYERMKEHCIRNDELTDFLYIKAIKPASVVVFSRKTKNTLYSIYWRLGEKKIRYSSEKEYINRMRSLVTDSIEKRLKVSDKRVGSELSGGLDSTVISVLVHTKKDSCFCSWSPQLYEMPMQDNDERKNIEDICKKHNMKCHYLDMDWFTKEKEIVEHLETVLPVGIDALGIERGMECLKKEGVDIIFSGWGGDEGVSHRCNAIELWFHREYMNYFKLWWERTKGEKYRILRFCKRVLKNIFIVRKKCLKVWDYDEVNDIEEKDFLNELFEKKVKGRLENFPVFLPFDPIRQIENGGNRTRIETVAVYGARQDVQYVFPFLDYRVEDYAVSIPRKLYLNGYRDRYIYREAFKKELGNKLYNFQNKDDTGKGRFFEEHTRNYSNVAVKHIMSNLDEEYWKQYLDFSKLREIVDDLKDKSHFYQLHIVNLLTRCYRIQILQKRIKSETLDILSDL